MELRTLACNIGTNRTLTLCVCMNFWSITTKKDLQKCVINYYLSVTSTLFSTDFIEVFTSLEYLTRSRGKRASERERKYSIRSDTLINVVLRFISIFSYSSIFPQNYSQKRNLNLYIECGNSPIESGIQ